LHIRSIIATNTSVVAELFFSKFGEKTMWCRATFNHKVSKKDSLNLYNLPNSKLSSAWSHLNLIELIRRISLGPI